MIASSNTMKFCRVDNVDSCLVCTLNRIYSKSFRVHEVLDLSYCKSFKYLRL